MWYVSDNATGAYSERQFGQQGDVPVSGDYSGDGRTDYAIWRPSSGTWWVNDNVTGVHSHRQFGTSGDVPLTARPSVAPEITLITGVLITPIIVPPK